MLFYLRTGALNLCLPRRKTVCDRVWFCVRWKRQATPMSKNLEILVLGCWILFFMFACFDWALSNLNLMWNIGESSMWGCGVTFVNMFISSVIDLPPFCGMSRQRWDLHGASAASPSPIAVELHLFDVRHFDCCKCGAWRSFFYDRAKTNDTPTYQRLLCVKHSTPNNQNFMRFQLKVHHGAFRRPICQIFWLWIL